MKTRIYHKKDFGFHWIFFGILLAFFAINASKAIAVDKKFPFATGEKLTFQLKWGVIEAGQAVLEVQPIKDFEGAKSCHFVLNVKTSSFIDIFYKVRDRIEAYTNSDITRSLLYLKKAEGKNKRNIVVNFDWKNQQASYSNFGQEKEPIEILPNAFDPLSIFYGMRLYELEENKEIQFPVTDGKKCFMGKARVIKRENINLNGISYDTYLLEPELKHFGGVFKKSKSPKLKIWLTADKRRIPVKIKCKVVVGSIIGELVSADI